ncbi:MAG: antitoxin [Firmicutes bacterium]|jgi:antitoxin component of RelBE/YafQ-DinJ toxin-antitoxin module|nr:antitoxin [Bacillota bacterium]NBI62497.1 antitoxin [Clostridiales bacterium]
MKTISIRLEDTIYEELNEMLNAMGQTKQTFYESFTRTALRERSIPFIISAPAKAESTGKNDKLAAFARLEASRKSFSESIEYDVEREEAMNEKYGSLD